uniref:MULE transposase domain-containing protein n=1 Tax=Scylla olivacea TaxID=85551 RepID=A0A0P4VQ93_SCYOL
MEFTISQTNKGKKCLMHDGYKYRVDSTLVDGCISWRCTNKKCKGRLRTDNTVTAIVPVDLEHNHEKEERKLERQQLRAQVKRKATDDMTARPSKLIRTELHTFPENELESGDLRSIAQSLYRERRKAYPVLPKTREEVHRALNSMNTTTTKGEDFILENNPYSGMVIISCITNLAFLANNAEEIFVDGTFKSCPKFFYQLYTIHGLCKGHYIPLVYALLPGQSEDIYRKLWKCLNDICNSKNMQLEPSVIHVDFEFAMLTVLRERFPTAVIKCCRFHLGQAWWRKIQNLGLSKDYKDTNSDIGQWLKLSFGLHFIDPTDVEDCFVEEVMTEAPQDERCIRFADYLVDNYVTAESRYPPVLWAEIPSNTKRKNNVAESFHAHFNEQFYASHPSIFVFMDVLGKLQTATYVKIKSVGKPASMRKVDRDRTEYAVTQYNKFISGQINRRNYMKALGNRFTARTNV